MNTFLIVLVALFGTAIAAPQGSVSLTQDTVGNYHLKYDTEDASRNEQGFEDGKVIGTFTYLDTDGGSHTINYIASAEHGFVADGDIVQETSAVAAVRAAHLALVEKQRALLPALEDEHFVEQVLVPIQAPAKSELPTFSKIEHDNSAEIEAAKQIHFAAHQEAIARLAAEYKRIQDNQ